MAFSFLWLVLAMGCGGGRPDPNDRDAAVDADPGDVGTDAGEIEVHAPMPPAPPAPPRFGPCRDGFEEEETEHGLSYCVPQADVGECAGATRRSATTFACVPVGDPCPEGDFPDDVPEDAIYVLASAPMEGMDGTREHPFGNIQSALVDSAPGATIAIGKGTYRGPINVIVSTTFVGACAESTIINSLNAFDVFTTNFDIDFTLRNVTVHTQSEDAVLSLGARTILEGVVVTGGEIGAVEGTLTARDIVVRDHAQEGVYGVLCRQAECDVSDAWITGLSSSAIAVDTGATLVGHDVLVEDLVQPGTAFSAGIGVMNGDVTLERLVVRDAPLGIAISGGTVEVTDADLHRLVAGGIIVNGGSFAGSRIAAREAGPVGILSYPGSTVTLEDFLVVDGEIDPELPGGGIFAFGEDATLHGERVWIENVTNFGVQAGPGLRLELTDLYIGNVRLWQDRNGAAIFTEGGTVRVERALLEELWNGGVAGIPSQEAEAPGLAHLEVIDTEIRDLRTFENTMRTVALGVGVEEGCTAHLERVRIERSQGLGFAARKLSPDGVPASIDGSDIEVISQGEIIADITDRSIEVVNGATADLERVAVRGALGLGMFVFGGSTVALRDFTVEGVAPCVCEDMAHCAPFGVGLAVFDDGHVSVDGFSVSDSELCGAHIALGGDLTMRRGVFAENSVAVCVEMQDFDIEAISDQVSFRDNGESLQTMYLQVPEVAMASQ